MIIWKDIPGWDREIQVSNTGLIKRLQRTVVMKDGRIRVYPEKILKTTTNHHGYRIIKLQCNKKKITKQVHRIVAEVFINNPRGLKIVNHKNGIKTDNRVENLEWISNSGNLLHYTYELKGRLLEQCVGVYCLETGKKYISIGSAAREIGCTPIEISRVLDKQFRTARGFHWKKI
jgi:hypothetical protein